MISHCFVAYEV